MVRRSQPTLYIDTNIFSTLHFDGSDVEALYQHIVTRSWWNNEREFFALFTSSFTIGELSRGHYRAQRAAVAESRRVSRLPPIREVRFCAQRLMEEGLVPESQPGDAEQLAFATVNAIDYLLSWNHAHLVNVHTQRRLKFFTERNGWRAPLLVSPMTIPKVLLGQEIRRRDED